MEGMIVGGGGEKWEAKAGRMGGTVERGRGLLNGEGEDYRAGIGIALVRESHWAPAKRRMHSGPSARGHLPRERSLHDAVTLLTFPSRFPHPRPSPSITLPPLLLAAARRS